ncbi:MAG: DUF1926 domain-containing protein [Helicobacteraceae bacterium]|jgi:hypothetical protein|nr:DUF1926 domain-containing protein [Helicobacteraceae bacterium]
MNKTSFLLGVHSHQPIDNFDHVVLEAIAKSYRPFFATLNEFPNFKFSAHFSGWLLEFIQKRDDELFSLMRNMSERGQIEWFGGGFYEPILASIPSYDRKAQIDKLSDFLEKNFGQRPSGLWLTERVWDASIVGDLVDCGMQYAIIDDYHLLCAGVGKEALNGWYLTENGGKTIGLFPISQPLRYQAPFWEYRVVADNIAKLGGAAILFDDGEKFGSWPGTYEWVYEKKWLENFLEAVLANESIVTASYKDYKDQNAPLGLVYPPEVSYAEMGEWSLNAVDAIRLESVKNRLSEEERIFVRGATWKNFLVKYEESARIHRRALALSKQNPRNNAEFQEALLKAQCNDCLWHGIFGGLYLPSLRDTAWRYLIAAENALNPKNGFYYEDWNLDGYLEARIVNDSFIADFEPKGAALTGLYMRSPKFNLLNTLTRRKEAYHDKIKTKNADESADDGIKTIHNESNLCADEKALRHLVADRYVRGGFIDHLIDGEFDLEGFFSQRFSEIETLANVVYKTESAKEEARFSTNLVQKSYKIDKNAIRSIVTIQSGGRYAQEHNFHFADLSQVTIDGRSAIEESIFAAAKKLELFDPYLRTTIALKADRSFLAFSHPLYTVSQSESGVDLTCQGVAIALDFGAIEAKTAIAVTLEITEERQ